MAAIYALNQKGVNFRGRLEDISAGTREEVDVRSSSPFVIFVKPDGTRIEKGPVQGTEYSDDNANLMDGADIQFHDDDPDEPSLLDQTGKWKYTIAARFDKGTHTEEENPKYVESPYWDLFNVY